MSFNFTNPIAIWFTNFPLAYCASRLARQAACLYISKVLRVFFNLRRCHGLTSLAPPRKTWQAGASGGATQLFLMPSAANNDHDVFLNFMNIENRHDIPSSAGWRIWNRRDCLKNNDSISPRRTLVPTSLLDDGILFLTKLARQAACLYISKVLRVGFCLRRCHRLNSLAPPAHRMVLRSFF